MRTKLFFLLILLSQVASFLSELCHPQDKTILLKIKKELNNPTILSSWKPNTDCCKMSWYGVTCFRSTNHVRDLTISHDNNLTSKFPLSIGNLPYLESIYFDNLPNLIGPIPIDSISKLLNLKSLTITSTGMSGPIPNFPPHLKNLFNLDLSSNHFSGTLPPYIYKLPKLEMIYFYNNSLIGTIPSSYGYFNNKNLPSLLLSHNHLSGKLPLSLARLNTTVIELSYNNFEGDASMLFGSNKATREIYLTQNMFTLDFGKVELSKTMTTLDVSHNQIYGKLPMGIENILWLNVSYNRLCGKIPKGGNMNKFGVGSFLHNKCLCGYPLPKCK